MIHTLHTTSMDETHYFIGLALEYLSEETNPGVARELLLNAQANLHNGANRERFLNAHEWEQIDSGISKALAGDLTGLERSLELVSILASDVARDVTF